MQGAPGCAPPPPQLRDGTSFHALREATSPGLARAAAAWLRLGRQGLAGSGLMAGWELGGVRAGCPLACTVAPHALPHSEHVSSLALQDLNWEHVAADVKTRLRRAAGGKEDRIAQLQSWSALRSAGRAAAPPLSHFCCSQPLQLPSPLMVFQAVQGQADLLGRDGCGAQPGMGGGYRGPVLPAEGWPLVTWEGCALQCQCHEAGVTPAGCLLQCRDLPWRPAKEGEAPAGSPGPARRAPTISFARLPLLLRSQTELVADKEAESQGLGGEDVDVRSWQAGQGREWEGWALPQKMPG